VYVGLNCFKNLCLSLVSGAPPHFFFGTTPLSVLQDVRVVGRVCGVSSADPRVAAGDARAPRRLPRRLLRVRRLPAPARAWRPIRARRRQPRLRERLPQALRRQLRFAPLPIQRRQPTTSLILAIRRRLSLSSCSDSVTSICSVDSFVARAANPQAFDLNAMRYEMLF